MFERITFDPNVMGGRASIRGMRITVSLVVNLVANGMSTKEIVRDRSRISGSGTRGRSPGSVLRFGPGQRGSTPVHEPRGVKFLADIGISTCGLDFGELLAASGRSVPSVVLFRTRNQTPKATTPRVLQVPRTFPPGSKRGPSNCLTAPPDTPGRSSRS